MSPKNDEKRKIIVPIIGAAIMMVTTIAPVSAASTTITQKSNNTQHIAVVETDAKNHSLSGWFDPFNVYADKWYVMSYGVGVGAAGWTNLVSKSDGSYIYHYTTARAWIGQQCWDSARTWGNGKVTASTGNVHQGAISNIDVYYGTPS